MLSAPNFDTTLFADDTCLKMADKNPKQPETRVGAWRSAKKKGWWENKRASLLVVPLGKALNGTPHIYVADRWPSRTSPGNNCKVAHPVCR